MTPLVAYSAFVPSLPLAEAAARYCALHGVEIQVRPGRPEHWMAKMREGAPADLLCTGAEFLLDLAEAGGLVREGSRRSLGRRTSALVVPSGNQARIGTLEDATREGVRLGIAIEGCTLGLWDELGARRRLVEALRPRIAVRAKGCGALLGNLARREVDVAIGWANFDRVPEMPVEIVPLPDELAVQRSTAICVAAGSGSPDAAARFAAWLGEPEALQIYQRWGWEAP